MTRIQLTPVPETRTYRVEQVMRDGRRIHVQTFAEDERDDALKLVYKLNKRYGKCE